MTNKKNKKSGGKLFISTFLTLLTLGGIATGGYFLYKYSSSIFNNKKNNIGSNYYEESDYIEGNIKIEKDENQILNFNAKETDAEGKINPNFQYGNLTILENPFKIKGQSKLHYFLGEEGLDLLNKMFKKRAIYGPEINALKKIKINFRDNKEIQATSANGLYYPGKREIYIFINNALDGNLHLLKEPVAKRVEIIFGTIMHEYAHHIDNIYNKSIKKTDPNVNLDLIQYPDGHQHGDRDIIKKEKQLNNDKFLNEFRFNLNYHEILKTDYSKYIRKSEDFEHKENEIPVYKDFSSNDLFRMVNVDTSLEESLKFKKLFDNKHFFNNNANQRLLFVEPVNEKSIKYLFSFTELFPRELIKLSLGPNRAFYRKTNFNSLENFLYFKKDNGSTIFSAIGDDSLKSFSIKKGIGNDWNTNNIIAYAPNWIFKKQIENFVSNEINPETNENIKPFENVGDSLHKGLFKAYIDLLGWGQLISFAHYNINNDNENSINFGGYFQIPNNSDWYKNKRKKIILVAKNNPKKLIEANISLHDYNFIAKKEWDSDYDGSSKKREQKNYWTEKWIYPNLFKKETNYVSYIARNIEKEKLMNTLKNDKFDIKLWIDHNEDGKYDLNDNKEVFSLLNDNKDNNNGKNFYAKYINDRRVTNTFRRYYNPNIEYEQFKLEKDSDNKFYYSIQKY